MTRAFLRVAKVGGSLFDDPRLPTSLRSWLGEQPGINVLIAGGGPLADFLRDADERFAIGDSVSHRLCLQAMRVTADLLAAMLPEAELLGSVDDLQQAIQDRRNEMIVFDAESFARDAGPDVLPEGWPVTSDSIAARLALQLEADELVLFKSTLLPPNTDRAQASAAGLVDAYFVEATSDVHAIRWVNLRNDPPLERPML